MVGPEAAIETALRGEQGDARLSSLHDRLSAAATSLGLARYLSLALSTGSTSSGSCLRSCAWPANVMSFAVHQFAQSGWFRPSAF